MRLRRSVSEIGHDTLQATRVLMAAVNPLAVELEALLTLTGAGTLGADMRTTLRTAAQHFDLDAPLSDHLADLREGRVLAREGALPTTPITPPMGGLRRLRQARRTEAYRAQPMRTSVRAPPPGGCS